MSNETILAKLFSEFPQVSRLGLLEDPAERERGEDLL